MRILYIFPHPDDESFGPAGVIHSQVQAGHDVFLLTLTKGGATKVRHDLGLSVAEMGDVRAQEMEGVREVLGLAGMTILDLPDSGLKEIDPRQIEKAVEAHIAAIQPALVITYPVHGVSGFHDHLVTHAVVKRVYLDMRDHGADYLKRLAFFTLREQQLARRPDSWHKLNASPADLVDCVVQVPASSHAAFLNALDCYVTYKKTIDASGVKNTVGREVAFEIFGESFDPPLGDLTASLPVTAAR